MTIKPLSNRAVLKKVAAEETTKAGIILPGSAKEKPEVYDVLAVGPGEVKDGTLVKMTVKVGNKVLVGKYSGTEVKLENEEYLIVKEDDILATIE